MTTATGTQQHGKALGARAIDQAVSVSEREVPHPGLLLADPDRLADRAGGVRPRPGSGHTGRTSGPTQSTRNAGQLPREELLSGVPDEGATA